MNPIQNFIKLKGLSNARYLADGLYIANDGFQLLLFCERMTEGGMVVHYVAFEPYVLDAISSYLKD